jgi:hypothetical protein
MTMQGCRARDAVSRTASDRLTQSGLAWSSRAEILCGRARRQRKGDFRGCRGNLNVRGDDAPATSALALRFQSRRMCEAADGYQRRPRLETERRTRAVRFPCVIQADR